MIPLYLAAAAFGGVLLVASLVSGHGHGAGAGGDGANSGDAAAEAHGDGPLAVLGIRFWTFALAFFGLTGLVLTALGAVAAPVAAAIAGGVGLGSGLVASRVVAGLMRKPVGQLGPAATAHVGRQGRLLLPVAAGQRGKVRLALPSGAIDLVAEAFTDERLPAGAPVVVVELRGNVAAVAPLQALPPAEGGGGAT